MRILLSILLALFSTTAWCQTDDPESIAGGSVTTSLPGIDVDAPEYDFGDIFWGQPVSHTYMISNQTEIPVTLTTIRTDCGCSAILDDPATMNPGDSRRLTVTYEPENKEGQIDKRITVYTDMRDDQNPSKWFELHLRGRIVSILSINPAHVFFKKVHFGTSSEETVLIHAKEGNEINILSAVSGSENLQVTLESPSDVAGDEPSEWKLALKLLDTTPVGAFKSTVKILTDHAAQKEITINVLAYVRGPVSLYPTQCYLGAVEPGQLITKTFAIEKEGDDPAFAPPTVSSMPDWISASIECLTANRKYSISIEVIVPQDIEGRLSGQFVIDTQEPTAPRFEVPVFAYVLPQVTPTAAATSDASGQPASEPDEN
ncbi:DUF1573 domain-containing protein [bacterium]|nr:DUF1573 domain-containing protein [candidate division CSSED10-310 bacterium]